MCDMCSRFPPYYLYMMKGTTQKVYITEYNGENGGTFSVKVEPRFNDTIEEFTVYGVHQDQLAITNIGMFR